MAPFAFKRDLVRGGSSRAAGGGTLPLLLPKGYQIASTPLSSALLIISQSICIEECAAACCCCKREAPWPYLVRIRDASRSHGACTASPPCMSAGYRTVQAAIKAAQLTLLTQPGCQAFQEPAIKDATRTLLACPAYQNHAVKSGVLWGILLCCDSG